MKILDCMDWFGLFIASVSVFLITPDNFTKIGMVTMTGFGIIATHMFLRYVGVIK